MAATPGSAAWATWPGNMTMARRPTVASSPPQSATVSWLAAAAVALLAACRVQLIQLGGTILELLGATYLSMRYFTGPTCWLLFGFVFWQEPLLRLPLLLYHIYIISPAGCRAIGSCGWPWLMRSCPLYWGQARYFSGSKIVRTAELDPSRRYVFASHPHGLLGNAFFVSFCTHLLGFDDLFPGIRLSIGVLDLNLRVAFCREICLLHGLCDVEKTTLLARLRQRPGSAVFLAVGGAAESLLTQPGCMDLVLLRRKGFVRLALEAGADLVPVIAFGENECYQRSQLVPGSLADKLQTATKAVCGFTVPRGHGRGILNIKWGPLPEPVALVTVIGAPIRLPEFKGDLRSQEGQAVVEACHKRYCQALRDLYDQHKDEYAPDRVRDMRFVE